MRLSSYVKHLAYSLIGEGLTTEVAHHWSNPLLLIWKDVLWWWLPCCWYHNTWTCSTHASCQHHTSSQVYTCTSMLQQFYLRSRVLMHSKIFMNIIILWVQPTVHAYCAWCPSISTACVVPWLFLTGLLSGQCLLWLTVSLVLGEVWGCVPPQGTLCQLWGLRWEGSTVADLQNFCLYSVYEFYT